MELEQIKDIVNKINLISIASDEQFIQLITDLCTFANVEFEQTSSDPESKFIESISKIAEIAKYSSEALEYLYSNIIAEFIQFLPQNDTLVMHRLNNIDETELSSFDISYLMKALSKESQEEMIKQHTELTPYADKDILLNNLTEEEKLKLLNTKINDVDKILSIINSLSTDKNKLEAFRALGNNLFLLSYNDLFPIIQSFELDSDKLEAVSILSKDFDQEDLKKIFGSKDLEDIFDGQKGNSFDESGLKRDIIKTLKQDSDKIAALEYLPYDSDKVAIIITLKEDKDKFDQMVKWNLTGKNAQAIIQSYRTEKYAVESLEYADEKKDSGRVVEAKDFKKTTLYNLRTDEARRKALPKIDDEEIKATVISQLTDDDEKIQLLSDIQRKDFKTIIILSLSTDEKKLFALKQSELYDEKILEIMQTFESDDSILASIDLLTDKAKIIATQILKSDENKLIAIKHISDYDSKMTAVFSLIDIEKQLETAIQIASYKELSEEEFSGKKEILRDLLENNQEIFFTMNIDFLDKYYIELFGNSKFEQIACYKDIQQQICSIGKNDTLNKLNIIKKCSDTYVLKNGEKQWNVVISKLLNNLEGDGFDKLLKSMKDNNIDIENLSEKDIISLTNILTSPNVFNIENFDEVKNFELVKQSVLHAIINNDEKTIQNYPEIKKMSGIDRKKFAILESLFGINIDEAIEIIKRYGTDIDNITSKTPGSQASIDYIHCLQLILEENDEGLIDSYLKSTKDLTSVISLKDPITMEGELKTTYFREYKDKLFNIENARKLEGKNMYDAGVDFNILLTSVQAYSGKNNTPSNFEEAWNVKLKASQGICTSFISNEMMATAPVSYCCYGFNSVEEDSLMMSGSEDIASFSAKFVPTSSSNTKFFTPQEQINRTPDSHSHHNEMVVSRFNKDGSKVQPDYIVAFKKDGKIQHEDYVLQAQEDFGGIPIVVIDVDKCLVNEEIKILKLIKEYKETGNEEIKKQILQKVRNNEETIGSNAIGSQVKSDKHDFEDRIIADLFGANKTARLENTLNNLQSINTTAIDSAIQALEAKFAEIEATTDYADGFKDANKEKENGENTEATKPEAVAIAGTVTMQAYSESYKRTSATKLFETVNKIRRTLEQTKKEKANNIDTDTPGEPR